MPNWCTNQVKVIFRTSQDITRFQEFISGIDLFGEKSPFCFSKILPDPAGTYTRDWRLVNWGTEREVNPDEFIVEILSQYPQTDSILYQFDTAWVAPQGIYNALDDWATNNHIDIVIDWRYYEENMELDGYLNYNLVQNPFIVSDFAE